MYKEEQHRAKNRSLRETSVTGYSCKDFPYRTIQSCLLTRNEETAKNTNSSIRLTFMQKTSIVKPKKSFKYIACDNSSGPNFVKSPENPIRNICHKVCC